MIRARKGIVWLYRWQSEYTIIRPHATLSWSTLAVFVVARESRFSRFQSSFMAALIAVNSPHLVFEVLIVRTIQLAKGDSRADFGYFLLLVWFVKLSPSPLPCCETHLSNLECPGAAHG